MAEKKTAEKAENEPDLQQQLNEATAQVAELTAALKKAHQEIERLAAFVDGDGDDDLDVIVEMRRAKKFGAVELSPGDAIAAVRLAPGLTLNFLVDSVRGGFANRKKPPHVPPPPPGGAKS